MQRIGKLTLNRNPDNFFAETEQVAFHPGHIVPGIDFTNDPLLQGRLFLLHRYSADAARRTKLSRDSDQPSDRALHNNQRDGHMRQTINKGRAAYEPNTLGGGCPFQAGADMGGFVSYAREIFGSRKFARRARSSSITSARRGCFYESQTDIEKDHIVSAFRFELGKVEVPEIRERMVTILNQIDPELAERVAMGWG